MPLSVGSSHAAETEEWHAVFTLPHSEVRAEANLLRQGFSVFVPRFRKTVRHARQLRDVLAPVFPRYVFIKMDPEKCRWRSVNGTFGVAYLLTSNGSPQRLPNAFIHNLKARVGDDGAISFGDKLQPGSRALINAGPFADIVGTIERLDDNGRVRLLLDVLNGSVRVTMDRQVLRAV